jgi:hypothetical protein
MSELAKLTQRLDAVEFACHLPGGLLTNQTTWEVPEEFINFRRVSAAFNEFK